MPSEGCSLSARRVGPKRPRPARRAGLRGGVTELARLAADGAPRPAGPPPGRQCLQLGPVQQDVQPGLINPDGDRPACQRRAEPHLLPADLQVPDGGTTRSASRATGDGSAALSQEAAAAACPAPSGTVRAAPLAPAAAARILPGRNARRGRPCPATGADGQCCTPGARHPGRPAGLAATRTGRGRPAARSAVTGAAARLGHADPAITLRVYAHVIRAAETAAAEVFARVMSEAA